jgi:predicted metal-dependent hydrolase
VRSLDSVPSEGSSQNYYTAYFQLWNAQKYYEAHDVIEQLWLMEKNPELARFYQALIQAAGALVHLQKNFLHPSHPKHSRRLPPATRLFELALRNLEGLPNEFRALDLVHFRELLRRYRDEIVATEFKKNPWSPDSAPELNLRPIGSNARSTKSRQKR